MPHTVTNIEGFEIRDALAWNFTFGGGASGGIFTFTGAGLQRSGLYTALQVNQGWNRLPVGFDALGAPHGGGVITFQACVARVYFNIPFFAPGATTRIITFGRSIAAPTFVVTVEIDALRQLSLNTFKSGTPTTLNVGQWYRLELRSDQTSLLGELLIDGVTEFTLISPGIGSSDFLQLGDERAGANIIATYDDVLIESHRTNGSQVDYPGAGNVQRLLPTSVGTDNAWFGVPDNVNKHLNVDEDLPNDADYVESVNISDQTFGLTNLGALVNPVVPGTDIVRAVRVANRIRNQAGNPQWRMARIRSGATVAETGATPVPASGVAATRTGSVWQNDPDTGAPWLNAAVDALEAGIGQDNVGPVAECTLHETVVEHGVPFQVGRPRVNPEVLGGPVTMVNPPELGG